MHKKPAKINRVDSQIKEDLDVLSPLFLSEQSVRSDSVKRSPSKISERPSERHSTSDSLARPSGLSKKDSMRSIASNARYPFRFS